MKADKLSKYYDKEYVPKCKKGDLGEGAKLIKILEKNPPVNKKILDIGCGPGVVLKPFTKFNTVIGLDISKEYAKLAEQKGYSKVIVQNAEEGLPFESKSFDIVVCTDLIEHLFDTEFVGREIHRVLKDDGFAVLNVPNQNHLWGRIRFLLGYGINQHKAKSKDWNYFHIRFFTWKSWNNYLKVCGFKVKEFYPVPIFSKFLAKRFPNMFSHRFTVMAVKDMQQ